MDIGRLSQAIDHNGRVLDALIHVLGESVAKGVKTRMDEVQRENDERSYVAQLNECRKRVDDLTARRAYAASGCVVFGRASNGGHLVSGYDAMTDEYKKLFDKCYEGDVVRIDADTTVTVEGVFDLRKPEPVKSDIGKARMKGRRKGRK